jgi:hypothetical protein
MVGARVRRQQVAYAQGRGLSGRRACALLSVARSTLGYQSRLAEKDAPALVAMRRLAAYYPRYGYRRIRIFLQREGHTMSTDRTHRLWRPGCRYPDVGLGAGPRPVGLARCQLRRPIMSGPTTLCSTRVRMARR